MAKLRKPKRRRALRTALTIESVIKRVLPYGTDLDARKPSSWRQCPIWAADVFAAAAALAHASSCYAQLGVALSRNDRQRKQKIERAAQHIALGREWARTGKVPAAVKTHWKTIFDSFREPILGDNVPSRWKQAAIALVAISDEAFAGAGFFPKDDDGTVNFVWSELVRAYNRVGIGTLQLPYSMAALVPNEVACILPKSLTPSVGCTLRSLTQHLAYLPGRTIVAPEWRINPAGDEINRLLYGNHVGGERPITTDGVFNILLVPFPYVVYATDFHRDRLADSGSDGYFSVRQNWLRDGGKHIRASQVATFVSGLIKNAQRDIGLIHAVIFPETALSEKLAEETARLLARRFSGLELFVSGVVAKTKTGVRNIAAQYGLAGGKVVVRVKQSKHHRWRLEQTQIRQYHLGGVLDPNFNWWENIDVFGRTIGFSTNRDDAIISALVCEDLARYDPVLPVVAAVGPTLVIALLLDGPQLPNRWPGRYATVLAEDPGSAVLTLTNLGMVSRSALPNYPNRPVIGLWKDRHGEVKELILADNHHGLALTLNRSEKFQVTLDHRRAKEPTVEYRLGAIRSVLLEKPPKWLERRAGSA